MWEEIRNLVQTINLTSVISDFEKASHMAITQNSPNITDRGCYFHLR